MLPSTPADARRRKKAAWREFTPLDRTTRRKTIALVAGFVVALAGDAVRGTLVPEARVAAGYAAKVACTAIFANEDGGMRRDVAALEREDLGMLPGVSIEIDESTRTVRAGVFAITERVAVWIRGRGAVLLPDGVDIDHPATASLDASFDGGRATRVDASDSEPWPRGETVAIPNGAPAFTAAMKIAFESDDAARSLRTRAVVIVHRGAIVAERYADGFGPGSILPGWSVTKSVTNAMVGMLVGEGRLQPNAPAGFPEWSADARAAITLENLLRMDSGLAFDENYVDPRSDVLRMLFLAADMSRLALESPLERRPGERFEYSSGSSLLLQRAIRRALDDDAAYRALPARLFDAIGARRMFVEADCVGTFVGSSFAHGTARDFARFGLLYLDDGVAFGKRVLPEGFVSWSTTPGRSARNGEYGAHWWLNREVDGRPRPFPSLPPDLFFADGFEGQHVVVVPSARVVIVRLGSTQGIEFPFERFVSAVLADLT